MGVWVGERGDCLDTQGPENPLCNSPPPQARPPAEWPAPTAAHTAIPSSSFHFHQPPHSDRCPHLPSQPLGRSLPPLVEFYPPSFILLLAEEIKQGKTKAVEWGGGIFWMQMMYLSHIQRFPMGGVDRFSTGRPPSDVNSHFATY